MMSSRAEATKARILEAAAAEFSAFGIAGARVDRIANAAKANKNLIYIYFESKDRLFDAVFDAYVVRVIDVVPFTPEDLTGYVGKLFDFNVANPDLLRLATWHRLERGSDRTPAAVTESYRVKLDGLAEAQAAEKVTTAFPPSILLALVLAIAGAWGAGSPVDVPARGTQDSDAQALRAAVVEGVRRMLSD
jgi:AcrR family transcriptional regulator